MTNFNFFSRLASWMDGLSSRIRPVSLSYSGSSMIACSTERQPRDNREMSEQQSGARVAREWLKYAAIFVMLFSIGIGNAWGASMTFTFSSKAWAASPANWTSGKEGNAFTANQGIQVTTGVSGANGTSPASFTGISKILVQYCTNASKGKGTIKVKVGSGTEKSYSVSAPASGGQTLKTAIFSYSPTETGKVKVTGECSTNSIYIWSVTILYQTAVTLNANGGAADKSASINHDATGTTSFTACTRDGYTCTGYYTASSGGTKILNADGTFASTSISSYITSSKWSYASASLTLYAQWEADTPAYTITAARNNASYGNVSLSGTTITATPAACCEYASPAYTVSPAGSATVSQDGNAFTVTPSANTTVTINFQQKSAGKTVNFDAGAGVCATASLTEDCDGAGVVLPSVTASGVCKGWKTFAGWRTSAIATADSTTTNPGTLYAASTTYHSSSNGETLYAVFSKNKAGIKETEKTLTFGTSYASNGSALSNVTIITGITASATDGTSTNPTFYTTSPGTWRIYKGSELTLSSSIGKITKIVFTKSSDFSMSLKAGESGTLTSETWTYATGINSVTFSVSGTTKLSAISVTYLANSTIPYYCSDPNCCTSLDAVNGSVSESQQKQRSLTLEWDKLSGVDGTTPYSITCKQGSSDAGTIGDIDLSGEKATCTVTGLDCSTTYTFTITAHGDASHCDRTQENIQGTTAGAYVAPALNYSSTALTVGGSTASPSWATAPTHTGTLSYASSNPAVITVNSSTGVVTPVGAGTAHVIASWAQSADYCAATKNSVDITVTGNVSVSFNANGGSGEMSNQSIPFNTATALTANGFTAPSTCQYFYGWATSKENADAGTRAYENGQSVTINAGMELFAIWKTYNYTVTDGTNEGAATFTLPANVDCGGTISITCAADGTHKGNPTITATEGKYSAINVLSATSAEITGVSGNITVNISYAAKENYSITWKVNGEALTGSALDGVTTNVLEGGSITNLPASPAGLDCAATFMGWSADEIGLTPLNNEDDAARIAALGLFKNAANAPAIAANTTFHAVFATAGEGGGTIYNLVSSAANFTDGTYVVAALDGETYYFMDGTSAAKGLGVETTGLAASSVSEGSFAVSSLPSGAIEIEVEDDGDPQEDNHYYYIYYISGDDTYFLDDEGTKQSITWTTNTEVYTYHPNFDHNNTTDGCVLLSGSTAKVSQNGSDKTTFVRNYASDGSYYNDLYFFKKTSLVAYDNYVTKCCKPWDNPTVAYGSYNLVAGGEHASVTITGTQHGTPEFTSSNTSVIEVNANTGEVTPVGAGTAHVIVTWPSANDYCEKTLNSSDFTVTGIVAITFKLNGGSVAGDAEKTQEVTTGEDATLNSLATLGYVAPACKEFGGWAASEEDANAATPVVFKADGATINVSEATNLWAIWNTKTFAVIDGTIDASVASHSFSSTVACGSDLTITCAAAAAYKGNPTVTATGTHGEITVNSATSVTIANVQSAIAVSIAYETAKANYAITWSVAGEALTGDALDGVTTNVYEGDAIENLPSVADNAVGACANKFMGWSADEIGMTALDKDVDATRIAALGLFKDAAHAPAIAANTTFHAVFATLVSAGSTSLTKMVTGDTFANGDRVVITANGLKIGLFQETVSSSYVNYWEFEGDDPTLADLDDDKKIWDVTEDENNENKWNLGDENNGYLYNGTGSSNNAMFVSETDVSSWDLTDKEDGTFSLKALNPLSCRSDLTGDNQYKWRGGGAKGSSGTSALVIYKLTSTPDVYNNYVTECITVTYNANGGATTCTNDATVTTEDYIVCATEPTRDYYTFAGWLCSADAETYDAGATIDKAVIDDDFTLTAQWTPTNYSITYNLNGGTQQETPAPATSYTIESSTITLPTPSYGHKRFDGWFDNEELDGEPMSSIAAGSTGDVELWAKWSERYTVQFYVEDELTTIYRAADEKLNATVAGQGSAPADPPSAPALCSSKKFVGWSESAITLETDVAPGDLRTTDSYVSADKTFYAVWATDNGDETYSAYSTYCYNAFVPDGGTGKGNWSEAGNWSSGSAPDKNTRVVIENKEMTVDVTDAQAKEIVVKNEGKLVVAPGKAIIVAGKITKDNGAPTTAADLKVESSAAGNGTLIFENDGNAATVEMYSIGSTDGWKWQYIGVPFEGANAQATYYGAYLYKWNNGWTAVQKSDELEEFAGYCISYPAANYTYVMDGALAPTTEQSITVPEGKSMVVGNSWTAPIQITQLEEADFSGLLKNVYLYNTGNDEAGKATTTSSPTGDAIYAAGTYISVPIHSATYTDVKVISSLQGFFVKDDDTQEGDGTLSLNYSKHVRPSGGNSVVNGAMHAPKRVADETDRPAVLKMKVSGSQYDDRLILLEREDFTTGYDAGWDGDKMGDVATSPRITTTREDGTADAVAALPDLEGTLINFRAASTDDQYTLYFDYETEDAEPLYLLDLTNNAYTRVETGGNYTFFTTDKADHKRFALTRYRAPQITTGVEDASEDNGQGKAVKFIENDKLYILRNGVLYDGTGKRAK